MDETSPINSPASSLPLDENLDVPTPEVQNSFPIYEQLLKMNRRWALSEGSRHFDKNNAVYRALFRIVKRLDGLNIPYALVGGMALFHHGFKRFTDDVDLLVTKEDLATIHEKLEGLGYVAPFTNSKQLRDAELGVKIEFLTTGDFPGDGKAKSISFPDPKNVQVDIDGIKCISLPKLVELKLASGMTGRGRLKDLADVQSLIQALKLPVDLAQQLHPDVREKYVELWEDIGPEETDSPSA